MRKWNQPLVPVDYPSPPKWAIAQLISEVVGNDRRKRSHVIHNLGYSKPERAALRLDHLIRTGECSVELRAHLPAALGMPASTIEAAFAETDAQRDNWQQTCESYSRRRENERFVPRLVALHDRANRSVPIFALSLFGQRRLTWIELPAEVATLDRLAQYAELPDLVHRWQTTRDGELSTQWLGQPIGYHFKPEFETTLHLDAQFRLQDVLEGPCEESSFSLKASNREISGLLGLRTPDD